MSSEEVGIRWHSSHLFDYCLRQLYELGFRRAVADKTLLLEHQPSDFGLGRRVDFINPGVIVAGRGPFGESGEREGVRRRPRIEWRVKRRDHTVNVVKFWIRRMVLIYYG